MTKKPRFLNNQKGQTAVEYIMLTMVVVVLIMSLMRYVKKRVLGEGEACTPENKTTVCQFERMFVGGNYRYFRVIR